MIVCDEGAVNGYRTVVNHRLWGWGLAAVNDVMLCILGREEGEITSHNVWLLHSVWCYLNEEKFFCCLVILSE